MRQTLLCLPFTALALAGCDRPMESKHPTGPEEATCRAAVVQEAGTDDLTTVEIRREQAGAVVLVRAGTAREPWRCIVEADGVTIRSLARADEG